MKVYIFTVRTSDDEDNQWENTNNMKLTHKATISCKTAADW